MTANAALQDRAIDRAVDLRRYANGVLLRMIATLNRSDARLAAELAEALLRLPAESFTVERLEALLASVRETNRAAYAAVFDALEADLRELSRLESAAEASRLRAVVPPAIQLRFPIAAVAWEQVYAAALARPFQGRLLRDWATNLGESRMRMIRNAVRAGYVEGQTASDIIRAIRGTRALRYADGLLARPRRELATVVQTALSHTAQLARTHSYAANADLIKAIRWVSTLDSRTSPMCQIRDGLMYSAATPHRPLGHKVPWGDGPGRLHFNCRSVSVPVLKSWRELGIDADEMTPSTRASMGGQVPADLTFGAWLRGQSAARQDEILGATRGAMLRDGRLTLDRFFDDKGRWLTLAQLEDRT